MGIFVAIAGWVLGSVVLGLFLGRIFGISAKRRRAEEQRIASEQTEAGETIDTFVNNPRRLKVEG